MITLTGPERVSEPPSGWWNALIRAFGPAFYAPSWAPWLRFIITLAFIFGAYVVLRLME
jgi:hypothetical protein